MRVWKRKLSGSGGFTLVEMLIVVAIIAILIAVSIPLVGNALDRARHATDAANERAARAAMTIYYLTTNTPGSSPTAQYLYDIESETIVPRPPSSAEISAYATLGKCVKHDHEGKHLCIEFNWQTYEMRLGWGTFSGTNSVVDWDSNCSTTPLPGP